MVESTVGNPLVLCFSACMYLSALYNVRTNKLSRTKWSMVPPTVSDKRLCCPGSATGGIAYLQAVNGAVYVGAGTILTPEPNVAP
jgi:hypothetical protein